MTAESSAPPTATYRLQLQPDLPFAAAEKAVPYLAALGVSHLHLSPVLEAVPGSTHGYDVVDHARVRAELGGEEGLRALAARAAAHGLRLVVDTVPNHMAVPAPESLNAALWAVLRDGPASPYARWFDIDWDGGHGGRVLLPVLGGRLGDELGNIQVDGDVLRYHDHAFPIRPGTERLPLPRLLDAQWYRLAWWRLARSEINYRRFFTISELIGVRVEDEAVFAATHATILRLLREGVVDGLRIDHPDGLAAPGNYLARLHAATGGRWTVVEKILTGRERLPDGWACAGTTGYDALRHLDGLFVCPLGSGRLFTVYRDFVAPLADAGGDWEETVRRAAYEVVTHDLAAEVERLVRTAGRISDRASHQGDHAPWALRTAVRELLVRLPVYRPYATDRAGARDPRRGEQDAAMLAEAAARARAVFRSPQEALAVDLVRDLALGLLGDGPDCEDFCARFAQTSSALRAKSVEDTAFYRYVPLLSACEVGADPGAPTVGVDTFHAYCARIQRDWPLTSTVLSTHDTKRSADVRARIAVLTECPERWRDLLRRVSAGPGEGPQPPDQHLAWTAWQTAFGLGKPSAERLIPSVLKATREAGLHTSWTEQDAVYEEAVGEFLRAGPCGPAASSLTELAADLAPYIRANVLSAALLHLTMPGVPDLYQGTETEYTALVDPDNRRPPRLRADLLTELDGGAGPQDLSAEKLLLTARALRLRRDHPDWFGVDGTYTPLHADGSAAGHCLAFARAGRAVTVATRLSLRLAEDGGWRDTELHLPGPGPWRDLLTGRECPEPVVCLRELLARYPVALLVGEG
ncbi:malto-oligosyltrehalose synthase [Streptomyces rimosus]|uniref:malto-oligosyltrehalose synthase n=1 Tax=Streptomyces rimosus TaxID=1927 RepID=UPI0004C78370|nr:malto-oligosyltrehalose synthase [Streptomyces rimosus]